MACCLLCFSADPLQGDVKANRPNTFEISLMEGLYRNQPYCIGTYCCPPCCAFHLRSKILNHDMSKYRCCQGYFNGFCFNDSSCLMEQNCPTFCLALESCFCLGPSISSSRLSVMDTYDLRPDPCDNRLIRFTNCLQCFACVFDILAIFIRELRHLQHVVRGIADFAFYTIIGCMVAQTMNELKKKDGVPYTVVSGSEIIIANEDHEDDDAYTKKASYQ